MRVSELIKEGSAWDEAKIEAMFCPAVKDCILNTPIGEKGNHDEAWWRHDPKGKFSVKSAYLMEIGYYTQHPNRREPDRKTWSKLVWNASIPPKAKIFLWRAFLDFIPTTANLMRHHVPSNGICELCGDRWEDTEHCLLYCPKIAKVWKESRFSVVVKREKGLRLLDVAEAVYKEWGDVDYELWVMML